MPLIDSEFSCNEPTLEQAEKKKKMSNSGRSGETINVHNLLPLISGALLICCNQQFEVKEFSVFPLALHNPAD